MQPFDTRKMAMSTPGSIAVVVFAVMVCAHVLLGANADVPGVISAASAQTGAPQQFSVTIKGGKADTELIRATQGRQVDIALTSDLPAELHLHGYDILVPLEPGVVGTLSFIAKAAGRFPVEAHRMGAEG